MNVWEYVVICLCVFILGFMAGTHYLPELLRVALDREDRKEQGESKDN